MPINKKWDIDKLLLAIKKYSFNKHRILMFEYVLLKDFNDSDEDALELSRLLKNITCKINLIPFNEIYGEYKRPDQERIDSFAKICKNFSEKTLVLIKVPIILTGIGHYGIKKAVTKLSNESQSLLFK